MSIYSVRCDGVETPRANGELVMFLLLQVVSVFLASVAMSLALAHAFELPGKMRLDRDTYVAAQSIYYPGFTYGGFGEGLGMVSVLVLLLLTPKDNPAFWWTFAGLAALVAMQAVYWIVTHPVNKFWLKNQHLGGFAGGFFSLDPIKRGQWQRRAVRTGESFAIDGSIPMLCELSFP